MAFLLWLFSWLIIWTEQKTIHTSTFPNTLTPKMAKKRDLSFRSLIAITAKFNLHLLPNEGRYWLSWKAVNRYKFSTPDEDKTFSGSFSFGFENMMTSREDTPYPLSKIMKTTTMIPRRRFSSTQLAILTSYASKHACHLVCKFTTYLFIFLQVTTNLDCSYSSSTPQAKSSFSSSGLADIQRLPTQILVENQ